MVGAVSPFITYILIVGLVVGVVAMNFSVFREQRSKGEGIILAFKNPKIYVWYGVLLIIFFVIVVLNV